MNVCDFEGIVDIEESTFNFNEYFGMDLKQSNNPQSISQSHYTNSINKDESLSN